ncbi:unnamed protein product, partial [Discosporangium mesarthrocarpum]
MSASGLVESGSAGVKDEDWEGIWVMMNGLPGNMGKEVAAACLRKGFRIAPFALTGPDVLEESITVDDQEGNISTEVKLVRSNDFERCDEAITEIKKRCCWGGGEGGGRRSSGTLIVVDYTHPSAVNSNAELYARHGLDFVLGTSGGDR